MTANVLDSNVSPVLEFIPSVGSLKGNFKDAFSGFSTENAQSGPFIQSCLLNLKFLLDKCLTGLRLSGGPSGGRADGHVSIVSAGQVGSGHVSAPVLLVRHLCPTLSS